MLFRFSSFVPSWIERRKKQREREREIDRETFPDESSSKSLALSYVSPLSDSLISAPLTPLFLLISLLFLSPSLSHSFSMVDPTMTTFIPVTVSCCNQRVCFSCSSFLSLSLSLSWVHLQSYIFGEWERTERVRELEEREKRYKRTNTTHLTYSSIFSPSWKNNTCWRIHIFTFVLFSLTLFARSFSKRKKERERKERRGTCLDSISVNVCLLGTVTLLHTRHSMTHGFLLTLFLSKVLSLSQKFFLSFNSSFSLSKVLFLSLS